MNAAACYFVNGMESETSAIARGLRRRDPDLLDRLIEQYQHRLLRYLIYLTSNRELAEDMFQETWIRVLERGHQYDPKYEFSTWLLSIARHLTVDYLRKKKPASLDGLLDEEEGVSLDPPDLRPSALELIAQQEQGEQISAALVGIAAEYREAIVLRFQEGLALDEIAAVTGASIASNLPPLPACGSGERRLLPLLRRSRRRSSRPTLTLANRGAKPGDVASQSLQS